MAAEGIDRRVARTRRALHEALIRLVQEKNYDSITVQDIIDEADVGRATFYSHYASKDDLLRGGFSELRDELGAARARTAGEGPFAFALPLFEHACSYRNVYAALVGSRGGAIVLEQIRTVLADVVKQELPADCDRGGVPREVMVKFVVSTFITVMMLCLDRSIISSPAEAARIFNSLVGSGIGGS